MSRQRLYSGNDAALPPWTGGRAGSLSSGYLQPVLKYVAMCSSAVANFDSSPEIAP